MERSAASFRFARRLARRAGRPLRAPADLIGVEHKFEIFEGLDKQDFRTLADAVVGGSDRRWFPGDPHARFLPSGAMVTCDEREAELAIPPVFSQRGVATVAADEMLARRGELLALIRRFNEAEHRALELHGYATHLNVFVPPGRSPQVALRFARTVAAAAMLLFDLDSSPGMAVRAAGRRLELAGEYAGDRDDLRVALVFTMAAVMACDRAVALPELDGEPAEDPRRGGWFVDRTAFGDDVHVEGRMASLRLAGGGGTILAGTLMGEIWAASRALVEPLATEEELALVDATVAGARALPLERLPSAETEAAPLVPVKEFATILRERRRGEVTVRPVCVSWDAATMQITSPARAVFARVPLESFGAFARLFERGSLDRIIRAYATRPATGRLATPDGAPGLYDVAEVPQPELDGATARVGTEVALDPPRTKRRVSVAISWARTAGVAAGALAMFAGTAAFAYIGLRQSESRPPSPRPQTSVLGARESRSPRAEPSRSMSPTPQPTPSTFASSFASTQPSSVRTQDTFGPPPPPPPPRPSSSSPAPTPTRSTSRPTPTPTRSSTPPPPPPPSPTPTPTPTQSTNDSRPAISGTWSCGVKMSHLSFQVSVPAGAPQIAAILVNYNGSQVQPSPSPSYPSRSYSGSASAAVTPGGNHRWTISVRDQSGRVTTKTFTDNCT